MSWVVQLASTNQRSFKAHCCSIAQNARKAMCHIGPLGEINSVTILAPHPAFTHRTDQYRSSRKIQPLGVPQDLQECPNQAATRRVTGDDDILRVDRMMFRAGRWSDKVQPSCDTVLNRTRERVLRCFCRSKVI